MKGKVKWFNYRKGYGFITDENGNDIFVHHSRIKKGRRYTGYETGDEVEFQIETDDNGKDLAADVVFAKKEEEE